MYTSNCIVCIRNLIAIGEPMSLCETDTSKMYSIHSVTQKETLHAVSH